MSQGATKKIEGQLKGRPFLGGEVPSKEDIEQFNQLLGEGNVHLHRWVKHMSSFSPATRKGWPDRPAKVARHVSTAAAAGAPAAAAAASPTLPVVVGDAALDLEAELCAAFTKAMAKAFPGIDVPKPLIVQGKTAEFQCNNAMGLAKQLSMLTPPQKLAPQAVADKIIEALDRSTGLIEKAESLKQGFINVTVGRAYIQAALRKLVREGPQPPAIKKEKVLIDFSSPNIAKKMHVGHLRSTIIGDALARIFEFCGHSVDRVNHVGDWGTQFGMLIAHLKDKCPDFITSPPDIGDLVSFYKAAKARFDADPSFKERSRAEVVKLQAGDEVNLKGWRMLCDISRREFQVTYDRLQVQLKEVGESFYNPIIPDVLDVLEKQGKLEVSDGARIFMSYEWKETDPKSLPARDAERTIGWYFVKSKKLLDPLPELCIAAGTARQGEGGLEIKAGPAWVPAAAAEQAQFSQFWKEKANQKLLSPLHPKLVAALEGMGKAKDGKVLVPRWEYPLIVTKADGGYNYDTTDTAAAWYRTQKLGMDRVIYVTDLGQEGHFMMIFQMAEDAGWRTRPGGAHVRMDHVGFGVVCGPDGKKFKTRSGEVATLEDLINEGVLHSTKVSKEKEDERRAKEVAAGKEYVPFTEAELRGNAEAIGIGAIKYCDLRQNRNSDYVFDQDKMLSLEGNTAVYLQYCFARVCSMARKAGVDVSELRSAADQVEVGLDCEKKLALQLLRFPGVINKTLDDLRPNNISDYLQGLVSKFNDCYNNKEWQVVGSKEQTSRLLLCDATAQVVKLAIGLLGINVLDKI